MTPRKLLGERIERKRKILKAATGGKPVTFRKTIVKMMTDFFSETKLENNRIIFFKYGK